MKDKRPVPVLIPFLVLVSLIFIGILIFAYVATKKANPQMIEVGQAGSLRRVANPPASETARGRAVGQTAAGCQPASQA